MGGTTHRKPYLTDFKLLITKNMPKTLLIDEHFYMKTINIMASPVEANTTKTNSKSWFG